MRALILTGAGGHVLRRRRPRRGGERRLLRRPAGRADRADRAARRHHRLGRGRRPRRRHPAGGGVRPAGGHARRPLRHPRGPARPHGRPLDRPAAGGAVRGGPDPGHPAGGGHLHRRGRARLGFVQRLGTLDDAVTWANAITELAPLSVAGHKLVLEHPEDEAAIADAITRAWQSADAMEGRGRSSRSASPGSPATESRATRLGPTDARRTSRREIASVRLRCWGATGG